MNQHRRPLREDLAAAEPVLGDDAVALIGTSGSGGLWEWNVRDRTLWHDGAMSAIVGTPIVTVDDWLDCVHPADRDLITAEVSAVWGGSPTDELRYRMVAADGSIRQVVQRSSVVEWDGDHPLRLVGFAVDSTALLLALERTEHLLDYMTDAYFVLDPDWCFHHVNPHAEELLDRSRDELIGGNVWELFPGTSEFEDQYSKAMAGQPVEFEAYYDRLDCWFEVRAHPARDGIAVYFRDVTARHQHAEERDALLRAAEQARSELAHAATHDALTDLANRASSVAWLEEHLDHGAVGGPVAALFIDIDRFKLVNDTHGHAEGDRLLVEAARRLRRLGPPGSLVARLGGDEFVIAMAGTNAEAARAVAEDVLGAFREPFTVYHRRLVVTASVGIAVADAGASAVTLLRDADAALYQAKDEGRNRIGIFDARLRQKVVARLNLEADLREGLDAGQIRAHYQPLFDARSGRPVGVEALARWHHPLRGAVAPDDFIPVAEETGLILPLGEVMLDRAIRDRRALDAALGMDGGTVWVNVSARQLDEPGFVGRLVARVEREPVLQGRLGIEITESVLAADGSKAAVSLQEMSAVGVLIAIDDFGTGYSSFARLAQYPVDMLKIDRSMVTDIASGSGRPLVAAMIELAHAIGASACAEGVEEAEELAVLQSLGVDRVSGYHLARPADLADLAAGHLPDVAAPLAVQGAMFSPGPCDGPRDRPLSAPGVTA